MPLTALLLASALWALLLGAHAASAARQRRRSPPPVAPPDTLLSIVVCFHRAGQDLAPLVRALQEQTHAAYECILVDDRSPREVGAAVGQLVAGDARFRLVRVSHTPADWSPKKWAQTQGIAAAQHELILFTDADCRPAPAWVATLAGALVAGADLVIGPAPLEAEAPTLAARYHQWLNRWHLLQLSAWAAWGRPPFATGRSLGMRRATFERIGGHATHRSVLSGDDDLLLHQLPAEARVVVLSSPAAAAASPTQSTWGMLWRQRRRHVGASLHYPLGLRLALGLWAALELLLPLAIAALGLWAGVTASGFVEGALALGVLWAALSLRAVVSASATVLIAPLFELAHLTLTLGLLLRLPRRPQGW